MDYKKHLISEKVSADKAAEKVLKTINSATSEDQIETATAMARNFGKMYGFDTLLDNARRFLTGDWNADPKYQRIFMDAIGHRKDVLQHYKELNKANARFYDRMMSTSMRR